MPLRPSFQAPLQLPFNDQDFAWEHFERFCGTYMVAGTSLPNLGFSGAGPIRLRILDAIRYGTAGAKQRGIDYLATMENRATWVLQCKHMPRFTLGDAEKAMAKAETEFGARLPARYLLWVTGTVSPDAIDLVNERPNWTIWDGERISNEFLRHCPPRQACQIISNIFGPTWAKAFFPLPDDLLISTHEFYSRWAGEDRLFHHEAPFVGREDLLKRVASFAMGGKGTKALILSAPGGIGKTRLLRAIAERVETESSERVVRFTNPDASPEAEPPRYEDASKMSIFHDDAHRIETIPKLLVSILAAKQSEGSRLVLAARPGAEQVLRERLMELGYTSNNIESVEVKKLKKPEMKQLAVACLGPERAELADSLIDISAGCTLITLVGAELLRRGELTHLDLVRSAEFHAAVFHRFEGQELDRISSLDRPLKERLLRSIALLSPWDHMDRAKADKMADFLWIARGQVEAACDSLLTSGLLIRTHQGLRITPDLFSDHLVYTACYDDKGQMTDLIRRFLDQFLETCSQVILSNLAETEWRALQLHGSDVPSVIAPIWKRFQSDFEAASFWDRSQMLGRWKAFAVYQPARTLELAVWAMDMASAPEKAGYGDMSKHERVLIYVPGLLKPVAIWNDEHRQASLDLLWRLRRDFPMPESGPRDSPYNDFAEVAKFEHNFPNAPQGVLDWLERLLDGEDVSDIVDKRCPLLDTVLRPFFAYTMEHNFMSDRRTMVLQTIPISPSKTRALRHRAFALLTENIIPRNTVAAMNALPVLSEAFKLSSSIRGLPAEMESAWHPERVKALEAIANVARIFPHPLIHYIIRAQLRWNIIYGCGDEYHPACKDLVASLPDSFEFRLARFTLSWSHDDYFEPYDQDYSEQWHAKQEAAWQALKESLVSDLLSRHPTAQSLHDFLNEWSRMCADHGLSTHLGELLAEIATKNQPLALEILDVVHQYPQAELAGYAALLIAPNQGELTQIIEATVLRGLNSMEPAIVRSFLHAVQFRADLLSKHIELALLDLAAKAEGSVLNYLIGMIRFPSSRVWTDSLLMALLERCLSDAEFESLSNAAWHHMEYGEGEVEERALLKMMDRLAISMRLSDPYDGSGFLHKMARRHPRKTYELLVKRIECGERERIEGNKEFQPLPYSRDLRLSGLENEPDFEDLARSLFERILTASDANRWPWKQLFRIAVSRTSPVVERLLTARLSQINTPKDLEDVVSLLGYEGSLLVFLYPELTEAILKKARSFGSATRDSITWDLIHGSGPSGRGYTNGELDPQYRYLRTEAEKAALIHESNRILAPFYQKIVEMEVRDETSHRREQEAMMADDW